VNPFDLPGPEFLFFYLVLSVVVIAALTFWRRASESAGAPKMDLSDPYLIAHLRAGEKEALCVALISLIDRGLLTVEGTQIQRAKNAGPESVRRPIEKALMEIYEKPGTAASIFDDPRLKPVCDQDQEILKRIGFLPDDSVAQARLVRVIVACCILGGVGAIKIIIALDRGRTNVGFLVILMIVAIVIAGKLASPRLTARGSAMLADIQTLYSGLKDRATSIRPGGATVDALMLAAAFGTGALAGEAFVYARTLFPRAKHSSSFVATWSSSSCSSSSCSSGSSCGSSCGGGGCGGGCGGCGG
jgi:uncharacterized protein (TIGR04222 family)